MSVVTVCLSHPPSKGMWPCGDKDAEPLFDAALAEAHRWIVAYDPELIVVFGPDHFQGFFYDLMPSFCVGVEAESLGDWDGPVGPANVASDIARDCHEFLLAKGFDVAQSRKMVLDHGLSHPFKLLKLGITEIPMLPIFVNCAGEPLPPFRRVRELGAAVGAFLKGFDKRVLVIGSGGLSHDPPIPRYDRSPPEIQEMLTTRHVPSAEEQTAFVAVVKKEAYRLAAREGACLYPNDEWDREFLDILAAQKLDAVDDKYTDEEIYKIGGCGGHEIRNWVAACAAQQAAAGKYDCDLLYYRVVPEWFAGTGLMRAMPAVA